MDETFILPDGKEMTLCQASGVILVAGEPNTGKSTLARELFRQLQERGHQTAYLDGDPGQSTIGPPSTISVAIGEPGSGIFPPAGKERTWFVGAVSPRRHMLPLLSGAIRLTRMALEGEADAIVYDTSGLVAPRQGGAALKRALVDALQPSTIVAIQRGRELQELLEGWHRSGLSVAQLEPSPRVEPRDAAGRRAYRAQRFRRYFGTARHLTLSRERYAMVPSPRWRRKQVLALRNRDGFTLALGIVLGEDDAGQLIVLTSLEDPDQVSILEMGDLLLNPETFKDESL